jgi:cytochrome c oxidase cbb3-type subunit I
MSAASMTSPSPATGAGSVSTNEIDSSCRVPLLVLFGGAVMWLVAASVFSMIASLQFHSPGFLADHSWLSHGRVQAAAAGAQLYGFALPAGLGVTLWMLARLGGHRVAQPWLIGFGAKLWNLGVLAGVVGILAGDGTSFENLEMPRYAALLLFLAYLVIGLWTVLTFNARQAGRLSPVHWFLLAALFWFPWIYSTANLLLLVFPVRGVNQAVIDWWYSANLRLVWLGLVGLASAFYFVPRLANRALHSGYLALFAFWTLILFGSWSGIPASAPVPAWMPALSMIATVLTIIPALAVAVNLCKTTGSTVSWAGKNTSARFFAVGGVAFLLSWLMNAAGALPGVHNITEFTWFTVAQSRLNEYGFFAMTMFGAIYCIVPQVTGLEWPSARCARAHWWCATIGIVLVAAPLAVGGVIQGLRLNDPHNAFLSVTNGVLPFLRASTTGELLIDIGNLLLVANLAGLSIRYVRTHFVPVYRGWTAELKPAEVKP